MGFLFGHNSNHTIARTAATEMVFTPLGSDNKNSFREEIIGFVIITVRILRLPLSATSATRSSRKTCRVFVFTSERLDPFFNQLEVSFCHSQSLDFSAPGTLSGESPLTIQLCTQTSTARTSNSCLAAQPMQLILKGTPALMYLMMPRGVSWIF